jgi:hypothetical protein
MSIEYKIAPSQMASEYIELRGQTTVTRFWSSRADDDALGTVTEHVKKLDAWLGAKTSYCN